MTEQAVLLRLKGAFKMQSLWGRYRDYYEKIQVPADNKRGFKTEYHYKGEWYVWDISAEALKREKIITVSAEAVSLCLFIFSATRHVGFNALHVASGLAILSMVPLLGELWGVIRFMVVKQPMICPDFKEIQNCIHFGSIFRALFLFAAVIAGLAVMVMDGQVYAENLLTAGGHALSGALSLVIFRRFHKLGYHSYKEKAG